MTTTLPKRSPQHTAIVDRLEATGIAVGDGHVPDDVGWQEAPGGSKFVAYLTVHAIPGGSVDGPIDRPDDDSAWIWQVTAVGGNREQCDWAGDTARVALLDTPLTIAGRSACRLTIDTPDGAHRDDTVQPRVWMSAERYALITTPI